MPSEKGLPRATAALVLVFFCLTLVVFGPGTIYLTNASEFANTYPDLLLTGVILAAAIFLVLAALLLALKALGSSFYEKGLALILALGSLLWLQGNFLLWKYGPLDGRDIPWSKMARLGYIDGAIWIGVLAAAFVFSRLFVRYARTVCLFLLVVQIGYAGALFARHPAVANFKKYSIDATNEFLFSKSRNVILVVLDTFQTDFFDEIIRESPEIARSFPGFTFFRNNLGGYPFTELSVALMLTGRYYDNSRPFERWMKEAYEGNSIPRVLKANGWRVDLFPKISYSLYYSDKVASNYVKGVPFSERLPDVAYGLDLSLFRSLPHFIKPFIYSHQDWFLKRLLNRHWKASPKKKDHAARMVVPLARKKRRNSELFSARSFLRSADVKFVDAAYSESAVSDDPGAFKFYHLNGPHLPFVLDENLNYVRMEVNRQNYRRAAIASLKLVALFLERIRQLRIYDDSLIFIVGDHGAGYQGQKFVLQPGMPADKMGKVITEPFKINALPLMLAKPFGARGELLTSDSPVSLSDIPATVFSALGLPVDAAGQSIFSVAPSANRERRYLRYGSRDIYSYYGDMKEYIITGPAWLDKSWRATGRVFTKGRIK